MFIIIIIIIIKNIRREWQPAKMSMINRCILFISSPSISPPQ